MDQATRWIAGWIGITLLAFVLSYGALRCFDPHDFPISEVLFIGNPHAVDPQVLQEKLMDQINENFFRIQINDIQSNLLLHPWIKSVDVRKAWPNKLVVSFVEQIPAAKWGEKAMINTTGEVFYPEGSFDLYEDLPILEGPSVKSSSVWQNYLLMQTILSSQGFTIAKLSLAPRGAWRVTLNDGIILDLGKDDILSRLKRFVSLYKTHLQSKHETMKYVDLRYTRGLAVGWKSG